MRERDAMPSHSRLVLFQIKPWLSLRIILSRHFGDYRRVLYWWQHLLDFLIQRALRFTIPHTLVPKVTFSLRCLVAASNCRRSLSSEFPNCPWPQLPASHSNSWQWLRPSFTPRPFYPQGKCPRYPLDRRFGELQNQSERHGEVKILNSTGNRNNNNNKR
jgi:hypothetical protein